MAATDYPLNHALAVKRWGQGLMKEALKKTYALQFMGKGTDNLIQVKTELNKAEGDRVRFGIRNQLQGAGIQGDNTLEGNEEALETYSQDIIIDQLRHAVRSKGKMSEQRVPFTVRDEARDGLADWWSDRLDQWMFNQMCGNTNQADVRYTGMQAAIAPDSDHLVTMVSGNLEASISATSVHTFNLSVIDKAVEVAKTAKNLMRPISIGGDEYWVAFLHPYQVTDLRTSTNTGQWLDIQKAAMAGGKATDNPIFTGALGVYNKTILKESVRIPSGAFGSQVTPGAVTGGGVYRAVVAGAQALCMAWGRGYGQNTYSWVEELFDFKNSLGVAAGCIGGMQKTRFNGSDFATVVMSTYAYKH